MRSGSHGAEVGPDACLGFRIEFWRRKGTLVVKTDKSVRKVCSSANVAGINILALISILQSFKIASRKSLSDKCVGIL